MGFAVIDYCHTAPTIRFRAFQFGGNGSFRWKRGATKVLLGQHTTQYIDFIGFRQGTPQLDSNYSTILISRAKRALTFCQIACEGENLVDTSLIGHQSLCAVSDHGILQPSTDYIHVSADQEGLLNQTVGKNSTLGHASVLHVLYMTITCSLISMLNRIPERLFSSALRFLEITTIVLPVIRDHCFCSQLWG